MNMCTLVGAQNVGTSFLEQDLVMCFYMTSLSKALQSPSQGFDLHVLLCVLSSILRLGKGPKILDPPTHPPTHPGD